MPDTPEVKKLDAILEAQKDQAKIAVSIHDAIVAQTKTLGGQLLKKPEKNVEELREKKIAEKSFLDELREIIKGGAGDQGGGIFAGVKKMMKKYSKAIMGILAVGLLTMFSMVDMKKMKEMWKSLKGALIAMYEVLQPIAAAIWEWTKKTLIPETMTSISLYWNQIEKMFVSWKENFEGWTNMTWDEKIAAVAKSFLDLGAFFVNTGKIIIDWLASLFGVKGSLFAKTKEGEEGLEKSYLDQMLDVGIGAIAAVIGMFAVGTIFPVAWISKTLTWPLRAAVSKMFFGPISGLLATMGIGGGGADGKKGEKGEKGDKKKGKGPARDKKTGQFKKKSQGIWGVVKKMFGGAAKLFARIGPAIMASLMSMGPVGWGLILGLAVGGLIFAYWDEIKTGATAAFAWVKDSLKDMKRLLKSVMKGAKGMAVSVLRSVGLDSLADELEGTRPIKDTGVYADGPTPDDIKDKVAKEGLSYGAWQRKQKDKFKAEGGNAADWMKSIGGKDEAKQQYKDYMAKFGGTNAEKLAAQELKNKQIELELFKKEMKVLGIQSKLINVDISGTGQAGFDKLSNESKIKTNLLAKMFAAKGGGLRMTSGWRSKDTGDDAMWKNEETLGENYQKFLRSDKGKAAGLTKAEINAPANSDDRKRGIEKMRLAGFGSQHEHGNALDFSWPGGYNEDFGLLSKDLVGKDGAFPGAYLKEEGTHLHMSFKKSNQGTKLAQLAVDSGKIGRSAGGNTGAGSNPGTINNVKAGDNNSNYTIERGASDEASRNSREVETKTG